jgi:uncharacterized protein YbjQ (UPF0145 family)
MISTTSPSIEGKRVVEYKKIVFGEVIAGVDVIADIAPGLSNFFGGRSGPFESELQNARETAIAAMESEADAVGANAVISVHIDYEVLGDGNLLMVTASGTAVVVG